MKRKQDPSNSILRLSYNKLRNKTSKAIYKSKQRNIRSEIVNCKGDTRKLWNIINELTGTLRSSIEEHILNYMSDVTLDEPAKGFAVEFSSCVNRINTDCSIPLLSPGSHTNSVHRSLRLRKANKHNVNKLIMKLNTNKALGADSIRSKDIKDIVTAITPSL